MFRLWSFGAGTSLRFCWELVIAGGKIGHPIFLYSYVGRASHRKKEPKECYKAKTKQKNSKR